MNIKNKKKINNKKYILHKKKINVTYNQLTYSISLTFSTS